MNTQTLNTATPTITLQSAITLLNSENLLTNAPTTTESTEITSIVSDSRKATENSLFVALVGAKQDGHTFLTKALETGCTTVVVQQGNPLAVGLPASVTVLEVTNTYQAFAVLNASLYGFAGHSLQLVGVTGTNGKTTT